MSCTTSRTTRISVSPLTVRGAIRTAPFYGCWLGASLLTTEQGIAINDKGRGSGQRQQADARPVCHRRYVRLLLRQQLSLPDGRRGYGPHPTYAIKAIKQMGGLE